MIKDRSQFHYQPLSKLNYFKLSISSKIRFSREKELELEQEIKHLKKQIEMLKYNREIFFDLHETIEQIQDENIPNLALDFENPFDLKMRFEYKPKLSAVPFDFEDDFSFDNLDNLEEE